MRFGQLEQLKKFAASLQILSTGDLAIFLSTSSLLVVLLFLPQITGDRLPDFRPLDPQERKTEFFEFLDPIVADVSANVMAQRQFITEASGRIEAGQSLSWFARHKVGRLAAYYEVPTEDADLATEVLPALLQRVDLVPRSLVFIQAAKESGWGTSRFAIEGNNLFGQRCYSAGCGIAPAGVQPGANFGVARFATINASVASYVRNLNTHPQYAEFRRLRQSLRGRDTALTGIVLADSLIDYSERGEAYVAEIKAMIRQNSLEEHD
jgi:Bax protein